MIARILIIEDNETNLELMVYLFKAYGYLPLTARDGKAGLAALAQETPDLIICDLEMPGMNGYTFSQELKGRAEWRRIPLLAVTAYAMVGDRDRVLKAGFDGYLPKPISPDTFVRQVEAFLPPEKRSTRPLETSTSTVESRPHPAKRAAILVVDDSLVNLSLIRSTLEPVGYEVIGVTEPAEAAELARRSPPDMILSDLHMPRQSGLEFLRRAKADPELRSIPFLLFSASSAGGTERERALALGAEGLLLRPIEPQALLSFVEACLQKAKRN